MNNMKENRKHCMKGILVLLTVLTLLTAVAAPAFADDAVPGSPADVMAGQPGKEEVKAETAEEKTDLLPDDASADPETIYQRIRKIKQEFEKLYETHSNEIETLKERIETILGETDQQDQDSGDKDPLGNPSDNREQPRAERPDKDDLSDSFSADQKSQENDSAGQNHEDNKAERKPYVGLLVSTLSDKEKAITGVPSGVLVHQVRENTPAAKAGIQAYDIIVQVNGTEIASSDELAAIIAGSASGDVLRFHLYRQGSVLELDVIPAD